MLSNARTFLARQSLAAGRALSTSAARPDIARVTLIGRLAADPEVAPMRDGGEFIKYVVGCSHKQNGEDKVSWFRIASFEESSKPYLLSLKKGSMVYVEGSLKTSAYESEDGKSHTVYNISHRHITALWRAREPSSESSS